MTTKAVQGKVRVRVYHVDSDTEQAFDFYWMRSNGDGEIYGFLTYPGGRTLAGTSGFYRTSDVEAATVVARTLARRHVYAIESAPGYPANVGRPVPA